MNPSTQTLTSTLRQVRKAQRLSQLELSLRLGVSQRHVSFVESGRAKPSRELLLAWLQELDAPLVVRNEVMLQAGYAPVYTAALLDDPALEQINSALAQLLFAHDPMPALVIDEHWNLLRLNRGGQWLAAALMPGAAVDLPPDNTPINLLDLLVHPEGFAKPIINLEEVGPTLLAHLRHEASVQPALTPKVDAFEAMLHSSLGTENLHTNWSRPTAPVLTTRYATEYGELAFFSMFTTFGTPQDITLASLRVEHLFAADEATYAVLKAQVQ
ncbi:helix-turn-helix transcriptional regulator [Leptolyngbya sp. CCNP1308]|uniref:helix-turn-helix domain-containing protein n=1 Tax=Leptolyngbya sp. CCNP1308 TaxID=3110255 RepID=UPI002B2197F6|nr:helix-turn-helix transcriptional regulator [Leptolyngbya sp. CCNP1308]MEA5452526.1 helix-turn-helix transcriptional regulator [Leptolyngbya sp. CCNP1308]